MTKFQLHTVNLESGQLLIKSEITDSTAASSSGNLEICDSKNIQNLEDSDVKPLHGNGINIHYTILSSGDMFGVLTTYLLLRC